MKRGRFVITGISAAAAKLAGANAAVVASRSDRSFMTRPPNPRFPVPDSIRDNLNRAKPHFFAVD